MSRALAWAVVVTTLAAAAVLVLVGVAFEATTGAAGWPYYLAGLVLALVSGTVGHLRFERPYRR